MRRRNARRRRTRRALLSSVNAPSASELGFRSSASNMERDHGVGYDSRSIASTTSRSRDSSLRSSTFTCVEARRPGRARRSARGRRRLRSRVPATRAGAHAGRGARRRPRHHGPEPLERRAIAHGSAPDAERAGLEREVVRRDRSRTVDEDLSSSSVDHRKGVSVGDGERVQRGHARAGYLECEREAARDRPVRSACS